MIKPTKSYRDLKEFISGLDETQLDQLVMFASDDIPLRVIKVVQISSEPVYVHKKNPQITGILQDIQEDAGSLFKIEDYQMMFPAGTVFIHTTYQLQK